MIRDREGARPRFRRNPRLRYEAALRTLAPSPEEGARRNPVQVVTNPRISAIVTVASTGPASSRSLTNKGGA